jgi:maltose alpha-D-glucosyltransferase/alpha-amylase
VELDLATYKGSMPVEVFGKTRFPAVGEDPYPLTLGPHGFYWFALERAGTRELGTASPSVRPVPSFECEDVETLLRSAELGDALRGFLETRPWFAGRDRAIRASRVADVFKLDVGSKSVFVALVGVESSDFESDVYVIPLALVKAEMEAEETSVFAYVEIRGDDSTQMKWALVDALEEPVAARTLLEAFAETELASFSRSSGVSTSASALSSRSRSFSQAEGATSLLASKPGSSSYVRAPSPRRSRFSKVSFRISRPPGASPKRS